MSKKTAPIYQIKITLIDSKPPIWRRLLISSETTLNKLHDIIQVAMGWTDSHLHAFRINGEEFSAPMPYDPGHLAEMGMKSTHRKKLSTLVTGKGDTFFYDYDFGDDWRHQIIVEEVLPPDPKQPLPVCIEGKRACPPEDVGGIWGYDDFLEAIGNPNHPEHEMYVDWAGEDFDPEAFDVAEVNSELKSLR